MKNLVIEAVPDSPYYPEVNFNASTGVCEITGESYMEEAYKFYIPLVEWIKEFSTSVKGSITMHFKLTYFNTSSSRLILDILDMLKKYHDSGGKVMVIWHYDTEDPDVKDEVEDFEIESGLSIKMEPLK